MGMHSHKPRKRFGQHFLVDDIVVAKIVEAISPTRDDHIVEIGPGQGALTSSIVNQVKKLDAIELDRNLIAELKVKFFDALAFCLHNADALSFDFASLIEQNAKVSLPLRIIGNLPYNITTPLLFHLLNYAGMIKDMHFMVQKEVAERMAASPGSKTYGRLSVMLQYYCKVEILFSVAPSSFSPPPKVYSSFIRLVPFKPLPLIADDVEMLAQVVRLAFSQRRKTLRNSLRTMIDASEWQNLNIGVDSELRPEQLSLEHFVAISNIIAQRKRKRNRCSKDE